MRALIDAALYKSSRVFHKEADFQQELAWHLHKHFPSLSIRAEYPVQGDHIDLWLIEDDTTMAVELKYPKIPFQAETENESFSFGNDPSDVACYSYLEDITQLESLVRSGDCDQGTAVILTNNPNIWNNEPSGANYDAFKLYEGRSVSGTLAWPPESSASGELTLDGTYELCWQEYEYDYPAPAKATGETSFKFCTVAVGDL